MKLKRCILALVAMLSSFALTTYALVGSDAYSYVAKIGETEYTSFDDAIAAANQMTGDVTVEIYGRAEYTSATADLTGAYDNISFVGKTEDAEISITRDGSNGYISGNGNDCAVNFSSLTLSKPSGAFAGDAGFMNVAFTVYRVGAVNYSECTFANGACAAGCPTTYTKCTFQKSNEKYALWAYGADVTVNTCTFDCDRGIKMYAEGAAKTTALTVTDSDFSKLTGKPAIVLTYGESVTLEGNTYSDTGVFELDLYGAPNGTTVTSDVAPTCKNDNGACGVLVDGKIYTTVAEAAAVATSGSTVTLLHNSTETVQLPEGVTLDKNGFTADGVTEAGPTEVATFEELVAALANGGEIKLTADIEVNAAITAVDGTVIDLNGQTLSVNVENSYYNNVSIKNGNIVLGKDDVHVCDGYFLVNEGKTLELTDVNVSSSAEGIKGYAVFHLKTGANLDLINCQLNISNNEYTAGYIVYAGESTATLDVTNTTITGSQVNGVVHATTVIENSTVTLTDVIEHGINRSATTIDDSNVTISGGTGRGITAQHGDLVITGNSVVNISEMGEATIELRNDKNLTIAETATVTLDAEVNNTTNGTITGTVTVELPVAKIGETSYASLAEAIAAIGEGDVVIELLTDATLDYNAREAFGVAETTSVTINGNGKVLTLNQKDSDWASIGLAAGKLVLNNMTIEKTGYGDTTGAWNTHAIIFTTEVEMNDVTINNAIAVEGGATLNNVAINEANGYYGLWIDGNGQTVTLNGGSITATNGGRGIKIGDEYVSNVQKVTLNVTGTTFNTAKKAAVLVSSTAGANITASNVNIENVVADNQNLVWVDEDWAANYGEVTVTGGTVAQENVAAFVVSVADAQGNVKGYYTSIADALAAAVAGDTVTILAGSYTTDITVDKAITLMGETNAEGNNLVNIQGKLNITADGASVKNLNVNNGSSIAGYINAKNVLVEGCSVIGGNGFRYCYTDGTVTFKNSTITGSTYGIHFDGNAGGNIVIDNCVVTGWTSFAGTIENVAISKTTFANGNYNKLRLYQNATLTDCVFNENMSVDFGKNGTTADFSGCTVENDGSLLDVIYLADLAEMGIAVTIDGTPVNIVAKIGETYYVAFEEALAAAQVGDTISLLADVTCSEVPVYAGAGVVNVDVNGHVFVSASKERVRNVASADGAVASNNIKFVSGFGWEMYVYTNSSVDGENFRVFPTLDEAIAYEPAETRPARIYPYENVKQDKDVVLRKYSQGTSSTICVEPEYNITWDLNGYTVLQESPTGNPLEASIRGTFVLDDSSEAKTGKWIAGACGVTNTSNSWYGNGGPAFYVLGDGNLTLKGGTISIARNESLDSEGKEIVNSGGLVRIDGGNLAIDGATLQVDDTYGVMAWGGNVTVNSGKFVMGANGYSSVFAMKYYADASVTVNSAIDGVMLIHSSASATVNAEGVKYYANGTDYVAPTIPEGFAAIQNLDGLYVIGAEPTATVNNLGKLVVPANDYHVWDGSYTTGTTDMPLSFVMQFLADQTAEDMETSPYADWYGDFVITFEGLEGDFVADGCYLAGYYGSFGWVKVPVDGMTIGEGVRYPVMLGVGMGQKYDYICESVKDFRCALYLTPEVLAANPNIKVNLELSIVDNSKGEDAAAEALVNNTNVYQVGVTSYTAEDFAEPVAKIGDVEYKSLQAAIDAAQAGETITVLRDVTLTEGVTIAADDEITLDLNGKTITGAPAEAAAYAVITNKGSLTISGEGAVVCNHTLTGSTSYAVNTITNSGALTIDGATIENKSTASNQIGYAIDNNSGTADAVVVIESGTVTVSGSNYYDGIRQFCNSTTNENSVTVNGGEVSSIWLQNPSDGSSDRNTKDVNGSVTIANGTVDALYLEPSAGFTAAITGGHVGKVSNFETADGRDLENFISGGTFTYEPAAAYIALGYSAELNSETGYYGIEWTGNVDELVIVDGELTEFVNEQEMTVGKLTYKRTLASSYNALYVPFEIPVDMLSANYDVFYIYDVRTYDDDENGEPDRSDMEIFKVNKGTLKANYPYFIRPKTEEDCDLYLELENAKLYKAESNSVVCSSVFMKYEIKGLYDKVESGDLNGYYGVTSLGRWMSLGNATLKPFRFYMEITDLNNSSVQVDTDALSSMHISVIGEGSVTDIEHMKQESNRPDVIYDLQGRRVDNPTKGFYIVNGKKVYIK